MFAAFNDKVIHPLYSTVSVVYHMELISRQVLLPFLEDDEEGMGAEICVKHLSTAKEGTCIVLNAVVTDISDRIVCTSVEAVDNHRNIIAQGTVKQAVLPKIIIERMY
ncbi:thioesterase [Jeotgalibacillus sp. S-D1]|nr:thioesterase [Jeotgalibacillus sp. S-D1]